MSLENLIFRCLERFWSAKYNKKYGLVTSYDADKHAAKVKIQPGGQETGWLPIHAHHIGNGWGIVVGLQVGDQVEITHQEGDFEVGAITNRIHSDVDKPPKVKSGEILFKHQRAGTILFDNDKKITWTGANGQTIVTDGDGNTSIKLKLNTDIQSGRKTRPVFTVDMNDGQHKMTIDPDKGIEHSSSVRVSVKAPQIEHHGDMKVNGSVIATSVVQSKVGFNGPVTNAIAGAPPPATDW